MILPAFQAFAASRKIAVPKGFAFAQACGIPIRHRPWLERDASKGTPDRAEATWGLPKSHCQMGAGRQK